MSRLQQLQQYLLRDNGYPSYFLSFNDKVGEGGHSVFVYKEKGSNQFGSIGINHCDINPPIYDSLDDLAKKISRDFGDKYDSHYVWELKNIKRFNDLVDICNKHDNQKQTKRDYTRLIQG